MLKGRYTTLNTIVRSMAPSTNGAIYMTSTKGLEGVVATQSAISSIIDDTLTYVGYDIDDLSNNARLE